MDNVEATPVADAPVADTSLVSNTSVEEVVNTDTVVAPVEGNDWQDFVNTLDPSIKDSKTWDKFKSPQELAKSYTELQSLVGKKGDIPNADATSEDWNDFYGKLGRPDTPDEYGINITDGIEGADARLGEALKLAHEAGLTKSQAEKFFTGMIERETADIQKMEQVKVEAMQAQAQKLDDTWGNGKDGMLDSVARLEKSLGVYETFEANGLNNNADMLLMLGELSKRLGEDPAITTNIANTNAGIDNSISEVNEQIKEYLIKGAKVPAHLENKRSELFAKKYN